VSIITQKVVLHAAAPPPFALSANLPTTKELQQPCPEREVPIVIDTGASWSVTRIKGFVSEITDSCQTFQSPDGTIDVAGSRIVEGNIQDRD
jgi:hypothetical protein